MVSSELHDLLAQLASRTARLEALQAELAARDRRRRARAARRLPLLLVVLCVALTPLSLLAANPFGDLNPGSVHNADIDTIYNAGVTTGCVPNAEYCPNDFVTRQEMASFLARLGGLGTNPPVANASNSQQLNGLPASSYLRPVGDLVMYASLGEAIPEGAGLQVTATFAQAVVKSAGVGEYTLELPLPVPGTLFGVSFGLASVEICYQASDPATVIDATIVYYARMGYAQPGLSDGTDRNSTSFECYTVSEPALNPVTGVPVVDLILDFKSTTHAITFTRIKATFSPIP